MKSNKFLIVSIVAAGVAASVSLAAPEPGAGGQAKLRPSHELLKQRQEQEAQKLAEKRHGMGLPPLEEREIKYDDRKKLGNLMDRSSVLCLGGFWTLVPKRAVIHIPATYKPRVDGARSGKLIPWPQFYARNRGWLQTHSVSISEARGDAEMDPKKVDVYKRSGRVVVAVCHNGPISVLPLKEPEEPAAGAVADAGAAK